MIDLGRLKKADLGRRVVYRDGWGAVQEGELSSWNDRYVFVKFKGPDGVACEPRNVEFAVPAEAPAKG